MNLDDQFPKKCKRGCRGIILANRKRCGHCPKGCKGRDITREEHCSHIEKRLPKPSKRSVKIFTTGDIERFTQNQGSLWYSGTEEEIDFILDKLKKAGFRDYEIEILKYRVFQEKTMKEIVKEGTDSGMWTSIRSASYHYKQTLAKLRKLIKNGFTLR